MIAICIAKPGGPEVLKACESADAAAGTSGSPHPRGGGRSESPGPDAARRAVPAAAWRVSDIPGLEVSGTVAEVGPERRAGTKATRCVRSSPAAATPNTASRQTCNACRCRRPSISQRRRAMPETFFTVWTNVFERGRLQSRRVVSGPRRRQRHRHDSDPDGAGVRRPRVCNRRLRREVRGVRAPRGRARDQLRDQDFAAALSR